MFDIGGFEQGVSVGSETVDASMKNACMCPSIADKSVSDHVALCSQIGLERSTILPKYDGAAN